MTDEFYLKIALSEADENGVSHASGKMIMMTNLIDQEAVMKCYNDDAFDCFALVEATTKTDDSGKFILTLSFTRDEKLAEREFLETTVRIKRIILFGVTHEFPDLKGSGTASDSQTEFTYTLRESEKSRYPDSVVEITPQEFSINLGQTVHFEL